MELASIFNCYCHRSVVVEYWWRFDQHCVYRFRYNYERSDLVSSIDNRCYFHHHHHRHHLDEDHEIVLIQREKNRNCFTTTTAKTTAISIVWTRFMTIATDVTWSKGTRIIRIGFHHQRSNLVDCNCSRHFEYYPTDNRVRNVHFDCNDN